MERDFLNGVNLRREDAPDPSNRSSCAYGLIGSAQQGHGRGSGRREDKQDARCVHDDCWRHRYRGTLGAAAAGAAFVASHRPARVNSVLTAGRAELGASRSSTLLGTRQERVPRRHCVLPRGARLPCSGRFRLRRLNFGPSVDRRCRNRAVRYLARPGVGERPEVGGNPRRLEP